MPQGHLCVGALRQRSDAVNRQGSPWVCVAPLRTTQAPAVRRSMRRMMIGGCPPCEAGRLFNLLMPRSTIRSAIAGLSCACWGWPCRAVSRMRQLSWRLWETGSRHGQPEHPHGYSASVDLPPASSQPVGIGGGFECARSRPPGRETPAPSLKTTSKHFTITTSSKQIRKPASMLSGRGPQMFIAREANKVIDCDAI